MKTSDMELIVTDPPELDGLGRALVSYVGNCCFCEKPQSATAPIEEVKRWRTGDTSIQDIFPEMETESREILIQFYSTRIYICSDCQAEYWGDEWRPE